MKFRELIESRGVYIAANFDKDTENNLNQFTLKYNIPNRNTDLHTTIIYSRKYDNIIDSFDKIFEKAYPVKFEIFGTEKQKILVLVLSSDFLSNQHTYFMNKYNLDYDYDSYIPHITLSYNIGDFDISKLNISYLPREFNITSEYKEDLDINYN